jgi:hypothetical protein
LDTTPAEVEGEGEDTGAEDAVDDEGGKAEGVGDKKGTVEEKKDNGVKKKEKEKGHWVQKFLLPPLSVLQKMPISAYRHCWVLKERRLRSHPCLE